MENFDILIFLLGFAIGWFWQAKRIISKLMQDPERSIKILRHCQELKDKDQEQLKSESRRIRVERHGSTLYLYAKDTNEFLAQGPSLQEALAIVEKRFPNENFHGQLSKEEADSLGITVK